MSVISSYSLKDICTPKLLLENVIGIKYNKSLQTTRWGPMRSVSDKRGTLAKFCDIESALNSSLNANFNSRSDNVVDFESLMQLMYFCSLSIRDQKNKNQFESWDKFDMVLGKFIRGINKLKTLLSQAGNNQKEIDSILEHVPEKEGKDRKVRVLNYLNQLQSQIVKWQRELKELLAKGEYPIPTLQVGVHKIRTKKPTKKPLDTHTSSSKEKPSPMSASSESDEGSKDPLRRCDAPGYGGYFYLTENLGESFELETGVTIDIPKEASEYKFIISGDCTKNGKQLFFKRKLENTTPLDECLSSIAEGLLGHSKYLKDTINAESVETLKEELRGMTDDDVGALELQRCDHMHPCGGIRNYATPVYLVCIADDRKTLLPFLIQSSGMDE